jgi:DNA-binding response OmpR family regulator
MDNLVETAKIISEIEKLLTKLKKNIFIKDKNDMRIKKDVVFYYEESIIIANKKVINLTKTERYIMNTMLNAENNIVSYETLCSNVYGYYDSSAVTNIRVAISRLRKKVNKYFTIETSNTKGCYLKFN